MLNIDGSYGEGGGQILRTAVALSVLTNTPIEITNIRSNRPTPGLKPQHYTAVSCMKTLCNAKTKELTVGSSHITFMPGKLQEGSYTFDIGTAGSMILVFQTIILGSLHIKKPMTIRLKGGTDVKWAPSWDYFKNVFLPYLKQMGINTDIELLQRGYYPKGGGDAQLTLYPYNKILPFHDETQPNFSHVNGFISITNNLSDHIAERMKHAAIKTLLKKNLSASIIVEKVTSLSEGAGITLWCSSNKTILGSTVLGEKGYPAESVGEKAATELLNEIDTKATLDVYAFDQLLPYMTFARIQGNHVSCRVRLISDHAQTNMWLINQFFKEIIFQKTLNDCSVLVTLE
ncbi:MAG: RNA 3'-terminal phosphate cyclase [Euryarchaeota archaeon]|nr:RNA 3'-terminal phosphate cyclase [Euryarchaeota archaeon]